MEEGYLKKELFELSHYIFNIQSDVYKSTPLENSEKMSLAFKRLADLIVRYRCWDDDPDGMYKEISKIMN